MERDSFFIVSGDSMQKLCLSTKFHTMKLGEITVLFAVAEGSLRKILLQYYKNKAYLKYLYVKIIFEFVLQARN